jgi:hypothetical protein
MPSPMSFKPNFKWQMETRHEAKARKDREAEAALAACYKQVDERDKLHSRRSGKLLTKGHAMAKHRVERHHMKTRGLHPERINDPSNVITLAGDEHAEVKAGKARYSGDANLRDGAGHLCGVKYERIGDYGWYTVGMI